MAKKAQPSRLPLPKTVAEVNQYITAVAEAKNAANQAVEKANAKLAVINADLAAELTNQEEVMKLYAEALFKYWE